MVLLSVPDSEPTLASSELFYKFEQGPEPWLANVQDQRNLLNCHLGECGPTPDEGEKGA